MSQANGGQQAKLHVAQRRTRKLLRLVLAGGAVVCVSAGGSVVASATGHNELAKEGVAVELVTAGVTVAGAAGVSRQQAKVLRLKQGQEISGR